MLFEQKEEKRFFPSYLSHSHYSNLSYASFKLYMLLKKTGAMSTWNVTAGIITLRPGLQFKKYTNA
jgi:hypothetical protein